MKHLFTLLFCVLAFNLFAQSPFDEKISFTPRVDYGVSNMQIIYKHISTDPVLKETKVFENILLIGDEVSLFMNYGQYQVMLEEDSIGQENITVGMMIDMNDKYDAKENTYFIVKTYAEKNLLHNHFTMVGTMYYYEAFPDFKWDISSETKEICGMMCQKATSSFRGRVWNVWFAPNIKVCDGPWKFSGLPGLVLSASSEDGDHIFECEGIHNDKSRIRRLDSLNMYFKTTREGYNKSLKRGCINPSQTNAGMLTRLDGTPVDLDRLFYNPEELK